MTEISISNTQKNIENKAFFRARLYFGLLLVAIVVGLNSLAHELALYWIYDWFDNPMHISGGVAVGYLSIFIWRLYAVKKSAGNIEKTMRIGEYTSHIFASGIVGALIFGLCWEFLERAYGLSGFDRRHIADTLKDLINDMMGGIIAALIWEISLYKLLRRLKNK